jgi:hypothetical protein
VDKVQRNLVRHNLLAVTTSRRTIKDDLLTVAALLRRGGVLELARKVGRRVARLARRG